MAINEDNFCNVTKFTSCDPPQSAGSTECCTVTGLNCNTTYFFVVTAKDDAGNRSPVSNSASGSTRACSWPSQVFCP